MERQTEHQRLCGRRKCRNDFNRGRNLGRWYTAGSRFDGVKKPLNAGVAVPARTDRGVAWALAVNRSAIYAPRWMIEQELGAVPLAGGAAEGVGAGWCRDGDSTIKSREN